LNNGLQDRLGVEEWEVNQSQQSRDAEGAAEDPQKDTRSVADLDVSCIDPPRDQYFTSRIILAVGYFTGNA
jgi:hypothetical protein